MSIPMPTVKNTLVQKDGNIRYEVMAYRTLSQRELLGAVSTFVNMMRRKPKKNTVYTVISTIGMRD